MELFKKTIGSLFVLGVLAFMLMGSVIVIVQFYSIMTVNGPLAVKVTAVLGKMAFIVATVTGLLGFIQGYVNGWEMGD